MLTDQSIVATMLATGDVPRARRTVDTLLLLGGGLGVALALVIGRLAGPVASTMSADPAVLAHSAEALHMVALLQVSIRTLPPPQPPPFSATTTHTHVATFTNHTCSPPGRHTNTQRAKGVRVVNSGAP